MSWKIPIQNGWFRGTPISGNLHMHPYAYVSYVTQLLAMALPWRIWLCQCFVQAWELKPDRSNKNQNPPSIHIISYDCWWYQPILAGTNAKKGSSMFNILDIPAFYPDFSPVPPGFPPWHSRLQHLLRARAALQCGTAGARRKPTRGVRGVLRQGLVLPGQRQPNRGVPKIGWTQISDCSIV